MDEYQKTVHRKFNPKSWLSNKKNFEHIIEWTTMYRRNMPFFIEHYLGIHLHFYQIFWIYMLSITIKSVIIAGRASAKSFVVAVFAVAKCILYPNSKVVLVSGNKAQAGIIVKEKIEAELMPISENLRREIKNISKHGDDVQITFQSGSTLTVVVGGAGALGHRSTLIVFEEFKRIAKNVVDEIILPFQMVRLCEFRNNKECLEYGLNYNIPELLEEASSVFISSAAPTSHWMSRLLKDTVKSKYSDDKSCMFATDYSIALKHNIKTKSILADAKRTTDSITWRQEYENEMLKEGLTTYFPYDLLIKNQKNKKAFYPRRDEDVRLKRKNPYFIPKQTGEIRILSCDMAFIERGTKNDNSCFSLIRALPETTQYKDDKDERSIRITNGYRRIIPYLEAMGGRDIDKQAIRIKQLYYDFDCDVVVLDTRNGGEPIALLIGNDKVINCKRKRGV